MNVGLFAVMLAVLIAASFWLYQAATMLAVAGWFLCVGAIIGCLAYADYRALAAWKSGTHKKPGRR